MPADIPDSGFANVFKKIGRGLGLVSEDRKESSVSASGSGSRSSHAGRTSQQGGRTSTQGGRVSNLGPANPGGSDDDEEYDQKAEEVGGYRSLRVAVTDTFALVGWSGAAGSSVQPHKVCADALDFHWPEF